MARRARELSAITARPTYHRRAPFSVILRESSALRESQRERERERENFGEIGGSWLFRPAQVEVRRERERSAGHARARIASNLGRRAKCLRNAFARVVVATPLVERRARLRTRFSRYTTRKEEALSLSLSLSLSFVLFV